MPPYVYRIDLEELENVDCAFVLHQVDKMASLFNIHIRTGCFCNTGACQHYLVISNQDVKTNLQVYSRKNNVKKVTIKHSA